MAYHMVLYSLEVAISLTPSFRHPQSVFRSSKREHTNRNKFISFTAAWGLVLNDTTPLGMSP